MDKRQTSTIPNQNGPIDWQTVLITGAAIGVAAGLLSKVGTGWFNITVPFGMMVASWLGANRSKHRYFMSGLISSLAAGMVGWIIYLALDYQTFLNTGAGNVYLNMLQLTLAFLAPMVLFVSLLASWLFSRTRLRVMEAQKKAEAEKQKRNHIYQNRPKKKYKKKK